MKIKFASIVSDETIVGQNYELSDMSNPNGFIYGKVYQVEAVTAEGRRFLHNRMFEAVTPALQKLTARVEAKGEINLDLWTEGYEIYGSPAWQAKDAERDANWAMNPATRGAVRDY